MRRRFALVFNDRAGSFRPLLLERVRARIRAGGGDVELVAAQSVDDVVSAVRAIAQAKSADAVIAAGGDGTIRAVASGASGTDLPVGVIPLGTGNVLRHEIGLTARPGIVAATLLEGPLIQVEGGLVNGAPFFLMVGAGFDGGIIANLNMRTKRILGRAAYTGPVIGALLKGPRSFDVEIDGAAFRASWMILTKARHYGGAFTLTRRAAIGAPSASMIAVLVTGEGRTSLIRAAIALAAGRLGERSTAPRGVEVLEAQVVRAGMGTPVAVEIDGDAGGLTPVEVHARGPRFNLIVPPAYVAGLTKRHTNHLP